MTDSVPILSVVLSSPDGFHTLARTIDHLNQQSIAEQMELIIVAPESAPVLIPEQMRLKFQSVQLVGIDVINSLGRTKARGVRAARGPVVAFMEEHVYAHPHWAEAMVQAHGQDCAVVGPLVQNANEKSLIAWGDFIITYGQWMQPQTRGHKAILPGHNSSYKRNVLLEYGDRLEPMLEVEAVLHSDLQSQGKKTLIEPDAIIQHLGFDRIIPSLPAQYHIGRLFSTSRAKHWSWMRRLVYSLGSPLIPPLRLYRLTRQLMQAGNERQCPYAALPFALPGLLASALGEMLGYALGAGNSQQLMVKHEFHRVQHQKERV